MQATHHMFRSSMQPCSPRLRRHCVRLPLRAQWCSLFAVFGVDLEEVVEDDHEHGGAAEEDCEGVERVVCDHLCGQSVTLQLVRRVVAISLSASFCTYWT